MTASVPSSRTLIAWTIVVVVSLLTAGTLVAYQRNRNARPSSRAAVSTETSIPQLTLEELARDFRSPALRRRYKDQLVEVAGTVVWTMQVDSQGEQGKPGFLVYLASAPEEEAVVCCALRGDKPSSVHTGEEVVIQGKVGLILYEGPQKVGLVDASIVRRESN